MEPVFLDWKPTDRILALTESQKVEIKQRLNVTVEVGSQPAAPPPIESFMEMVSLRPLRRDTLGLLGLAVHYTYL